METIIEVENIKCSGCMNSIKTALMKIENIEEIKIDLEKETIYITGNADKVKIISKLNELGYPEKGNNSFTKKAKSYVNCAIGKMS